MLLRSSFESKVLAAFIAAALVVAGVTFTGSKLADDAEEANGWVAHSHQVLGNVAHIRANTLQIELSTQSFRISGDPAHLAERDVAAEAREAMLSQLRQLTADNPLQQERWTLLRQMVDERLAISRRVEMLRKTQGPEAANAYVATAPLQKTRDRIHELLRGLESEEATLLRERTEAQLRTRRLLLAANGIAVLVLAGLLAGAYALIKGQLRETRQAQRALADSEEGLATTMQSIGDAVLATDIEGRVTRMNPVAEQLTGWTFEMARGLPIDVVFRIINEITREPAVVPVAQVLATGVVHELANHTTLIARDGTECPIADSAAPIRTSDGQVTGVVLVFRDETLARKAQRMIVDANALLEQRVQERTAQLRTSEDHLHSVINNVPAVLAYVDADQRYVYVNAQHKALYAPDRDEVTGHTVREILGEERYAHAAPRIERTLKGERQSYDWQPFAGKWLAIDCIPKHGDGGRVLGYYVLGSDITVRKQAEEKVQALNTALEDHVLRLEHTTRALKTLSAGNRTMLRAVDEQGLLSGMCEAIVTAGGYAMAVVWCRPAEGADGLLVPMAESTAPLAQPWLRALNTRWQAGDMGQGVLGDALRSGLACVGRGGEPPGPDGPAWLAGMPAAASVLACPLRVDGAVIGALAIYSNRPKIFEPDEITFLVESADDLAFGMATLRHRSEQARVQEAMQQMRRYDALTGLPNEAQFTETLVSAIDAGQPFAVLQANVERLSEINDALGFCYGDQILKEVGARLVQAVPPSATVGRLRGDEFAILLPQCDAQAAVAMVRTVDAMLAQPFAIADIAMEVSVTAGVALFPAHGETPHDLYRHMDTAVHQAKKAGLGHLVFDPAQSHHRNQAHHLQLAGELRRAIENGDLALYLQPKIDMATGQVRGAEGLVRWRHAQRGLLMPGEFIGLAEHTGLIKPLTEWVIEASLRLNHGWGAQGASLPIAVNLSARNLRDESLLQTIRQLQATWPLAPGMLELEITETTVMGEPERALRVLQALRDLGIALYIDDFGTGYSSLSYLQQLPVEYIKIDQSFVCDMSSSKTSSVIVRSTIDLAHDLGRKVVAEGIESQAHWDQLAALGCDIGQGYFLARPMPAQDLPRWMAGFVAPVTGARPETPFVG